MNKELQEKLIQMRDEDLNKSDELIARGELHETYHPEMEEIHLKNAEKLAQIFEEWGWPNLELVEDVGVRAAWLVLQHSIGSPHLLKKGMKLIEESGDLAGVSPIEKAKTVDRILFLEGKKQKYGTNFDWNESGKMMPTAIEDRETVDERRQEIGLNSLEESIVQMHATLEKNRVSAPEDLTGRRQRFEEWLKAVGWRK